MHNQNKLYPTNDSSAPGTYVVYDADGNEQARGHLEVTTSYSGHTHMTVRFVIEAPKQAA